MWAEMAVDITPYCRWDPYEMTPRQVVHMHGLVMASKRRWLAIKTNAQLMACNVGFNGDKNGKFDKFLAPLTGRTVIRRLGDAERTEVVPVEDDQEARDRALEIARAVRERGKTR